MQGPASSPIAQAVSLCPNRLWSGSERLQNIIAAVFEFLEVFERLEIKGRNVSTSQRRNLNLPPLQSHSMNGM